MSAQQKKIELLAPARNLETGIAAIDNGADAVYIGAENYGARHAAGNSVEQIAALVQYAHLFDAKVYVTLNTIIEDSDIPDVENLISRLYDAGVDALIVQDFGITRMNIPPIPLHASTQMDNRDADKVEFLAKAGFPRVVLARELTLEQIAAIHRATPDTELEVFVHGALCVSYSGQCYASQHCFGRSANRGECAQFCRLAFDLVDADGKTICRDKHLLSLKDMNRSEYIERMMDAGVTSFKIEGRLKDTSYVKNVTAFYRARIDEVLSRRNEYVRSSFGSSKPQFTPALEKSFNRGFTPYLLTGDKSGITSFDTPKSIGEHMGTVRVVARNFFTMQGSKAFNNGDGACFIGRDGKLHGFRINKTESGRIFPQSMPPIFQGAELYRNYDCDFERALARPDTKRTLALRLRFSDTTTGFALSATDEAGVQACINVDFAKETARTPQRQNIVGQLSKWGGTPFAVSNVDVDTEQEWFVPSSLLSDMRRRLCDTLLEEHRAHYPREERTMPATTHRFPADTLDYRGNVSNRPAREFYAMHGIQETAPAFEQQPPVGVPLMFCKHCIKYSFGWCSRTGVKPPFKEPLYLISGDGKRFRLEFDCRACIMRVLAE